jgi:hypothetical protein
MTRTLAVLAIAFSTTAACGTSGEPMTGDVVFHYGTDTPELVVGAAVMDTNQAGNMLVQLGSDNVDCDTYLDVFFSLDYPSGSFVYFSVDSATPGTVTDAAISVAKSNNNHTSINLGSGSITIDAVSPRVTGTLTATLTDETVGAIDVSGSFDVKRCF